MKLFARLLILLIALVVVSAATEVSSIESTVFMGALSMKKN
jgi:hypothetical protein